MEMYSAVCASSVFRKFITADVLYGGRHDGRTSCRRTGSFRRWNLCGADESPDCFFGWFFCRLSIISAQYFGAKQYQGIAKNALASMISLIVLGLCIGGLSIGFGRPMLHYLCLYRILCLIIPRLILEFVRSDFCFNLFIMEWRLYCDP